MKRIGDILIANGWIEPSILQRALVKQKETGHRLCSLLVLGGALDADEAACALGEQHGVAAALQRHLTRRDQSLAPLLSASLAHACVALPLGRMGNGDVIVCVRDPSPALEAQLARAMNESIKLAVALAHQLEALVLETYGPDTSNEFDVDMSTGPVMSLELDDDDEIAPLSDEALAGLGSLELVDLDDTGVSKDDSQTQMPIGNQRQTTLPPTSVTVDAPTLRPSTAPVVDAPSYRSSTAIVVDAPSQREPPGRAALSAAGIVIPRTETPRSSPPRETFDDEGVAIPRTQTPMTSGLDAAGAASAPREQAPPGRAALAAAGPAIARTETPRSIDAEIAVPRTRTPGPGALADEIAVPRTRTPGPAAIADEITLPRTRTPGPGAIVDQLAVPRTRSAARGAIYDDPAVGRTRTPGRPSLHAAADRAMESFAAAESAAVAASLAAASAAAAELMFDDEPAVIAPPPIEEVVAPDARAPKARFLAAKTLVPSSAVRLPAAPAAPPAPPAPAAVAAIPAQTPKPLTPAPNPVTPALTPAPNPVTPALTPTPNPVTPALTPTPNPVTPALAPTPSPVTPALAPTPNPVTPALAPTPKPVIPALTPKPLTPAQTPKPVAPLPSLAPPRPEGLRPPPAALAALQRASSIASRVPAIPPRPIPALPPRPSPAPSAVAPAREEIAVGTQLPTSGLAVSSRLAEALAALTAAPSIDRVCDAVMAFGSKRWSAVALFDVDGMSVTGRRGHGTQISDDLAQWVVMSLAEPSLLQAAFASRAVATTTPSGNGEVEHRLQQLLGMPRSPSASSISVEGKPQLILAVGDPDGEDSKTALADLERLGDATAAALTRLRGR